MKKHHTPTLSRIEWAVVTCEIRIQLIFWNRLFFAVSLLSLRQAAPQQSKASFDCIRFALSLHQKQDSYNSIFFIMVIWLVKHTGFAGMRTLYASDVL